MILQTLVTRQQGSRLVTLVSSTGLENLCLTCNDPSLVTVFSAIWALSCVLCVWEPPEAGSLCVWQALCSFPAH